MPAATESVSQAFFVKATAIAATINVAALSWLAAVVIEQGNTIARMEAKTNEIPPAWFLDRVRALERRVEAVERECEERHK